MFWLLTGIPSVWSTREGGWKSTRVIAPIIAGGVGLAAFVLWRMYHSLRAWDDF